MRRCLIMDCMRLHYYLYPIFLLSFLLLVGIDQISPSPLALSEDIKIFWKTELYIVHENGAITFMDGTSVPLSSYEHAQIISLANLYQVEKNDPLFYSPAVNTETWNATISVLEKKRTEFFAAMHMYPSFEPNQRKVLEDILKNPSALYPFEFIQLVPIVIQAHNEFIDHPSQETAEKLLEAEKNAANEYAKDAQGFSQITSDAARLLPYSVYLTLGNATTVRIIAADGNLIAQNGAALQAEVRVRENCFLSGVCPLSPLPSTFLNSSENIPQPPYKIPVDLITPPQTIERKGPYAVSSSCFGKTTDGDAKMIPMYLFLSLYQGRIDALPILANENYYWDVRRSDYAGDKAKAALGVTYDDQVATNFYMCNDNEYQANVMTLSYMENLIDTEGVIVPAEKIFLNGIPSDAIFPELYAQYEEANTEISKQRELIIENKLVGFDLLLNKMAELMDQYGNVVITNEDVFSVETLLGLRSAYSLLYMPFAKSVWRVPQQPQFLLPEQYPISDRYFTWDEILARGFDPRKGHIWDTEYNELVAQQAGKGNWRVEVLYNPLASFFSRLETKSAAFFQ